MTGIQVSRLDHLSVGLPVRKVYCGKTAEWIRMPFAVVSGVGRGMCVLDGVVLVEGEGAVLRLNLGRPIVTNGDFVAYLCESDALFPITLGRTFVCFVNS